MLVENSVKLTQYTLHSSYYALIILQLSFNMFIEMKAICGLIEVLSAR